MRRQLTRADLDKEMASVADKLEAPSATGEKRLDLLRRQAQLGDLRDALAQRERRDAQPPRSTNGS
jgi:hypothetical protein